MKVFILAGGLGTRIRTLFPELPKPLIPIHGRPFLEWQIEILTRQGFKEFVLCLSYRAAQIRQHFGNGAAHGIKVEYSVEHSPLGTAGALREAATLFQSTSLVLNGDTYLATNYGALVNAHYQAAQQPLGTIGLVRVTDVSTYGQVLLADNERIVEFREKEANNLAPGLINAGAYILEPEVMKFIPDSRASSLERDTFPMILASNKTLRGVITPGAFVDIGTPEGYARLEQVLK